MVMFYLKGIFDLGLSNNFPILETTRVLEWENAFNNYERFRSMYTDPKIRQEECTESKRPTLLQFPSEFHVKRIQASEETNYLWKITAPRKDLGEITEKWISPTKGSVFTFSSQGKILSKARFWTGMDHKHRAVLEDGQSNRIASLEQVTVHEPGNLFFFLKKATTFRYQIKDENDNPAGHIVLKMFLLTRLSYYDVRGRQVGSLWGFNPFGLFGPDVYTGVIDLASYFDPSLFLFPSVWWTTKCQREPNFLQWVFKFFRRS
eukprot:TRINITY_DN9091_c0_g2_i2.p1 TRINITY_DN9091_c0_g2~~TRINITY_DN9091_c0_g2_i2.p1  ORF type:complete len:262 (-),score=39.54 TRINITY_DN9091_c0_g2_i2:77-862(-)